MSYLMENSQNNLMSDVDTTTAVNHSLSIESILPERSFEIMNSNMSTSGENPGSSNSPTESTMTFTENQKFKELCDHLKKMRDLEKFCDVGLYVHGKEFLAHKVVLSSSSPFFESIFSPKSKEKLLKLSINCQEPEVFAVFMNYIYSGSVTINKENVGELMRLANCFHVIKLKKYCAEFLERYLEAENALNIKEVGDKFNMPNLSRSATIFIQTNLADVINHEILMEFPLKKIESFIIDKAWAIPQDASVKLMSRWVCHDLQNRDRDLKQLLTNIDWNSMDPNVIVEYIDQEPLYGTSERCFYYVLNSLAEKGIQVQKYENIYLALQQRFGQEMDQSFGFGDNLLQMAFNSAMEGTFLMSDQKWQNENDTVVHKSKEPQPNVTKPSFRIEQIRRRALARIQRNRGMRKIIYVRQDRPRRKLASNEEIAEESSGDEECDPIQVAGSYKCHLCPFTSKKVSRLERHLAVIHAHDLTFRCSECGFTCKWNRDYFLHMKSHFEGPPYHCQNCTTFSCQKIGSLIAHRLTHMDLKPFHCSECDYKCKSKANLAAHLKSHNNEKPYRCNNCGRAFASKNSLDQHALGHNTDKTYTCALCPFSTKYLNHFTNHKKTHHNTGKKGKEQYRCQDSQCKYTTSKKSQLDSHMRSHAGVRPHVCSICGRRFLEKSHLVRHERIHYNERPFKCEECDYASTRRDKLKEHKSRHHGINASAKSPYKPRPHKGGKGSSSSGGDGQNSGYSKKGSSSHSSQQQQNHQVSNASNTSTSSVPQSSSSGSLQVQQDQHNSSQDLEFIIPHSQSHNSAAFAQIQADLQIANSGGIVQIRQFQGGKDNQVAIPTTMTTADLQRLGVKLEDLQAQGIIGIQTQPGGRTIKIEELAAGVQSGNLGNRLGTMVLDAAQLQQLAASASIPISTHHQSTTNQNNNLSDSSSAGDFSNLLY